MQADILREKFLAFFKARKHKIIESDSLVPKDDPTVLFTPAGMNQFKKEFLGFDSGFKRAATSQRCLRTDDLDKVGKTNAHHTFFEMLGNFSFGDYFKDEAISWAWEFLTKELKIDTKRLWVSVYKDDFEAYKVWKDTIGIPVEKIIKLGDKDNFWPAEAKAKGPCGPCSEIFYDFGSMVGCAKPGCTPACSCGRFVEIWNLVFTQFNRKENGMLEPLPNKNIDTGMGLERLTAIMEGKINNFETDLFTPIIKEIKQGLSSQIDSRGHSASQGVPYETELLYAISDHIRAVTFAIYDGVLPSNEARGYVVRKIIRKSVLHLRSLGIKQPFIYSLVPVVAEVMQNPYPDLVKKQEDISAIVLAEGKNFIGILNSSEDLFKSKFSRVSKKSDPKETGRIIFKLYDTYGIPFELTKDWLDKKKIEFSQKEFDQALEEQKTRSKKESNMKGDVFSVGKLRLPVKETKFLGYESSQCQAKVLAIIKDNTMVKKAVVGESVAIILDKSIFYPESGGQVADIGRLTRGMNDFEVLDTDKQDKIYFHRGQIKKGSFKVSDLVKAEIDLGHRLAIARNHTATHLLQAALRKVLGAHVKQQGSLVSEEKLRFDFTHFKGLDKEQLDRIEEIVNDYILSSTTVTKKEMSLAFAKKTGALAFFGEKYSGKVRVVSIGDISKEFCGGTHLDSTGQIGLFRITQESSVAVGVRRIEAVTGKAAYKLVKEEDNIVEAISSALNTGKDRIEEELKKRLFRIRELEKQLNLEKFQAAVAQTDDLIKNSENINGFNCVIGFRDNLDMDFLRKHVDLIKAKSTDNTIVALGSNNDGRALLVIGVTEDLCNKGIDAGQLVRGISAIIGGSGGGRKDFAQAGGNNPKALPQAFEALKKAVNNL